jgi:hypothetical protein
MIKRIVVILLLCAASNLSAQENLLDELNLDLPELKTKSTFNATRLINYHTTELLAKKSFEFRIAHRFADVSQGFDNFFGLDGPASIQLSFDYAIHDNFTLGIGRTNFNKLVNGFAKYKLMQQSPKHPINIVLLCQANITHRKPIFNNEFRYFANRMSYVNQLLFSRKFSESLSFMLSPMYARRNLVTLSSDNANIFGLISATRVKMSKRASLTLEYAARLNRYAQDFDNFNNGLSVGLDLETGGHVFQMFFTNSFAINEIQSLSQTESSWQKSQFRLGFNVSRVFGF